MTNYTHDPSLGARDEEIQNFTALDCSGERYVDRTPEEAQCYFSPSFDNYRFIRDRSEMPRLIVTSTDIQRGEVVVSDNIL